MRIICSISILAIGLLPATALAVPEAESNDNIGSAQPLGAVGAAPLVVDGTIANGSPNDIDFYSFTGVANQFVALGISRGDSRSGSTDDVDLMLHLFRADGTVIAENDDTMNHDPLIANVRLPGDGTYFAAVTAYDNHANGVDQAGVVDTDLLLGGNLVTGATPDETFTMGGTDTGDYTLSILDSNQLLCVAHSIEEGDHGFLPFDGGKRKAVLYNGAPLAQRGVSGQSFNADEGGFDVTSAHFGPNRDPSGLLHFSVDSGTSSADLPDTGADLESGAGNRAADVFSSTRQGSNDLAIEGWRLGYAPNESGNMDALILGCASEKMYPIFDGNTIVDWVHDHTFPVYFTIDGDEFENDEADILVVTSSISTPRIYKVAAELGLDTSDEIDALTKIPAGFLFSLKDGSAMGLPGTAVRAEFDSAAGFQGTNIYLTPCDGTNSLFLAGSALGFGPGGDIDAMDLPFVAPPPPGSGNVGEFELPAPAEEEPGVGQPTTTGGCCGGAGLPGLMTPFMLFGWIQLRRRSGRA